MNRKDIRLTYSLIRDFEKSLRADGADPNVSNFLVKMKRELLGAIHEKPRHIFGATYDGFIEIVELPADLITKADAEEYVEEFVRIPYRPSYYDCTGQWFTAWTKVARRDGKWVCYHHVSMDV